MFVMFGNEGTNYPENERRACKNDIYFKYAHDIY